MIKYGFIKKSLIETIRNSDIFDILDDRLTEEELIQKGIRRIKQLPITFNQFRDKSDEEIAKYLAIVEYPPAKTFPKFNNEIPFTAFNGKYINPEIVLIRWHGRKQTWEYQLKNIGHIGEYYEEKYLTNF